MIEVDDYSRATVPIQQFFNDQPLGGATAFIWFEHGVYYLITNWHAVTMVDPNTGENLHSYAARPNRLHAQFNPTFLIFEKCPQDIALRDDAGKPLWLVHPVHGNKVDVVAIRLPPPDPKIDYCPINRLPRDETLAIRISMDVFVLGYPFGAPPPGLPVWKRGSIASEPQLAPVTEQYFLIDSASRPGMSGGPVILRSWGTRVFENGGTTLTPGAATRFVGVYSGRRHTNDVLQAQLGIVWPAALISQIISHHTVDTID